MTEGVFNVMIKTMAGDLIKARVDALVNPVNCVGAMGTGLALQFKQRFPNNFKLYKEACGQNLLRIGKVYITVTDRPTPKYIINFPTKHHWIDYSKVEYIDLGLQSLVQEVQRLKIRSIAIPMLGCGMGKLDWSVVRPRIEYAFEPLPDVAVSLYVPRVR